MILFGQGDMQDSGVLALRLSRLKYVMCQARDFKNL